VTASIRLAVFAACAALALAAPAAPAGGATGKNAQNVKAAAAPAGRVGIAAVVNDDIITFSEIEDRMRLYMLGAPPNLPEEAKQRVLQQALYRLVDEKLQMQEARALNILVRDIEIAEGFAALAGQNNLEPDQFGEALKSSGINLDTIQEQIRAEIAWGQVVRRKLRPQITISESEIDTEVSRLQHGSGRTEFRLAEIFLAFDGPATEKNARALAEKLAGDIRKGRPFSQTAREFSEAPGAATGGDIGWIEEGVLPPALEAAVIPLQPGQLSDPVRTDKGYHLLFLRDRRQKGLPAAAQPQGADDGAAAETSGNTQTASEIQREEVANRIGMQRLEQMAERYLRDLRATAFIEQRF
jgi:peptidyl-prolyl cis-trans isomerase SurA